MENYEQELAKELDRYNDTLAMIHEQLRIAERNNASHAKTLRQTNRDMWENASHSADDFESAANLSQYYQPLAHSAYALESSAERIRALTFALQSAYFARIDFSEDGSEFEQIYIGRAQVMDDQTRRIVVFDWRAPISSLFYRFETGAVFYDAPAGKITGIVNLKRQYEIKNGVFTYFFDADVQIADAFLRKMLSGNTSGKMKSIVETIQKDQDTAIRDRCHDLLMVQGIAGSGKTSVALHRVAYLKYQGLSDRLKSSDIIVLSPNTLFEQYVSNVLPELGEEEVQSVVFDDLVKSSLPNQPAFQTRYDQTEELITCLNRAEKDLRKQTIAFKTSGVFAEILNRYADSLPTTHMYFTDVVYDGKTVFTARQLKERLLQMKGNMSLTMKLEQLRRCIFEEIHKLRKDRMPKLLKQARDDAAHTYDWEEYARALSIEEHTRLVKQVDGFLKPDSIALYKKLIGTEGLLRSLSAGRKLPDNVHEILLYSQEQLAGSLLPNEDAVGATYLQLLIGANDIYKHIRQVVIDEAQDYYSIHFAIAKRLFPNARYTVLGDVNQTIEKQEDMGLYKRITEIIKPDSAHMVVMNKSFRCTKEILSFSMQYVDSDVSYESFNRSGDEPQIVYATDIASLDKKLIAEANYSKAQGYQSIGMICKDARQAQTLYDRLKDKTDIQLVRAGDNLNTAGVFVIPITMSKGLEFDSVLVYGTDCAHYHTDDDRRLLYIASTRALHRLNLFYTGEVSPLISGGDRA